MTVLTDDAVRLLAKWQSDDTPVSFLILAPGLTTSLSGFVSKIEYGSFTITHLAADGEKVGDFTLELALVKEWDYRDLREASESAKAFLAGRIASALQFTTRILNGVIYELAE